MGNSAGELHLPSRYEAAYAERTYRRNYRTVMVRFWREGEDAPWRATMLRPMQTTPQHFASVSELFANLWDMLNEQES